MGWHPRWQLAAALIEIIYWWQANSAAVLESEGAVELYVDVNGSFRLNRQVEEAHRRLAGDAAADLPDDGLSAPFSSWHICLNVEMILQALFE